MLDATWATQLAAASWNFRQLQSASLLQEQLCAAAARDHFSGPRVAALSGRQLP